VRRWLVVLVVCLGVAVAVPVAWVLTRPSSSAGVPVTSIGAPAPAASGTSPSAPATASPGNPSPAARPGLPRLTARPATPGGDTQDPPPVRLVVASAGIDAAVTPVGVDANGAMVVPKEVSEVGWYRYGSAPGSAAGAAVIAGHVDARTQGAGALFGLRRVGVGDRVVVTLAGGPTLAYRVAGKETIVKQRLPVERLFARDGAPRLVLITCGGPFLPELSSYRDNLVVVAVPAGQGTG
jgi:Sortase domain